MRALGIFDDTLEIEDAHSISFINKEVVDFSLRGLEYRHIIVCVTQQPKSFSEKDHQTIREELKKRAYI
jgi:hypothetical protein